jgi:hypothetical protein
MVRVSRFSDHLPSVTIEIGGNLQDKSAENLCDDIVLLSGEGKNKDFPMLLLDLLIRLKVLKAPKGNFYQIDNGIGRFYISRHNEQNRKGLIINIPCVFIEDERGKLIDHDPVLLGFAPEDDIYANRGKHVKYFSDYEVAVSILYVIEVIKKTGGYSVSQLKEPVPYEFLNTFSSDFHLTDF